MSDTCLFYGSLSGVSHEPYKSNIVKLAEYYSSDENNIIELEIRHEKDNKYDENALKVLAKVGGSFLEMGWVPKNFNIGIVQAGLNNISISHSGWNIFDDRLVGVVVSVDLK